MHIQVARRFALCGPVARSRFAARCVSRRREPTDSAHRTTGVHAASLRKSMRRNRDAEDWGAISVQELHAMFSPKSSKTFQPLFGQPPFSLLQRIYLCVFGRLHVRVFISINTSVYPHLCIQKPTHCFIHKPDVSKKSGIRVRRPRAHA